MQEAWAHYSYVETHRCVHSAAGMNPMRDGIQLWTINTIVTGVKSGSSSSVMSMHLHDTAMMGARQ